jgi:ABC-type cobalamin/Fe3+-siderophores transport system ATPase subunit
MKIALQGVVKKFKSLRALDSVSLSIEPGQVLVLLGPNGAGKTTLLRCLAAIVAPDEGTLLYDGERFLRERLDLRRRSVLDFFVAYSALAFIFAALAIGGAFVFVTNPALMIAALVTLCAFLSTRVLLYARRFNRSRFDLIPTTNSMSGSPQ